MCHFSGSFNHASTEGMMAELYEEASISFTEMQSGCIHITYVQIS